MAVSEPIVPNILGAVEAVRSRRRINTLSEGKRHVDSESEDDDVPITTILSKPPKKLPTPGVPKGNEAYAVELQLSPSERTSLWKRRKMKHQRERAVFMFLPTILTANLQMI